MKPIHHFYLLVCVGVILTVTATIADEVVTTGLREIDPKNICGEYTWHLEPWVPFWRCLCHKSHCKLLVGTPECYSCVPKDFEVPKGEGNPTIIN